jgi:hypothetical protein
VRLGQCPRQAGDLDVPRDDVAAATWIGHMTWLNDPTAAPGMRNAGIESARIGSEVWDRYADRWDLLDEPAADAPVMLPLWVHDGIEMEGVGLPPDHPWHHGRPGSSSRRSPASAAPTGSLPPG